MCLQFKLNGKSEERWASLLRAFGNRIGGGDYYLRSSKYPDTDVILMRFYNWSSQQFSERCALKHGFLKSDSSSRMRQSFWLITEKIWEMMKHHKDKVIQAQSNRSLLKEKKDLWYVKEKRLRQCYNKRMCLKQLRKLHLRTKKWNKRKCYIVKFFFFFKKLSIFQLTVPLRDKILRPWF